MPVWVREVEIKIRYLDSHNNFLLHKFYKMNFDDKCHISTHESTPNSHKSYPRHGSKTRARGRST